jgi:hypothetical protein
MERGNLIISAKCKHGSDDMLLSSSLIGCLWRQRIMIIVLQHPLGQVIYSFSESVHYLAKLVQKNRYTNGMPIKQ